VSKAASVEWSTVESLMLQSFTGGRLTEDEQRTVQRAYESDPKGYGERHSRIVREEVARKRRDGV
jgi:hypothetical protein